MFLFTIEEEASLIPLTIRKKNEIRMIADCPFCGKKEKMAVDFRKNVYNCVRCNTGGGLTTLYANYYGISNSQAYKEIMNYFRLQTESTEFCYKKIESTQLIQKPVPVQIPEVKLDMAYATLLSELSLEDVHRKNLFQRGLTDMVLDYYSVPNDNFVLGPEYEHIPGCYKKDEQIITNFPKTSGFIIPIRSFLGYIVGLQIRLDKPYSNTKYMWFSSSNKEGGSSSGSPIHFVGKKDAKYLFIIEGALKGNIANYLDSQRIESAACVAGVNNIKNLKGFLKQADPYKKKKIILGYDMDKFENHFVMEGEVTLYNMLYQMGYQPGIYNWMEDKEEVTNFYHGKSGNLIPKVEHKKIIGFSFVSILANRCGFDFYDIDNLAAIFTELKKRGLQYLNVCCEEKWEQTDFQIQVMEIFKTLGIQILYKTNVYDKTKKGIDDYLKATA